LMSWRETSTTFRAGCAFHQAPTLIGCFVVKERACCGQKCCIATAAAKKRNYEGQEKSCQADSCAELKEQLVLPRIGSQTQVPRYETHARDSAGIMARKSLFRNAGTMRKKPMPTARETS
jgi:hypothetical protein